MGTALIEVGFLDTPFLVTSGTFAVRTMGVLCTCLCLLLLFYTVESLERERTTRLAAMAHATPIRTGSLLLGKSVALAVVSLAIVLAVVLAGIITILIQHKVGLEIRPFLLVWGLLSGAHRPLVDDVRHGRPHDHAESLYDLRALVWPC